MIEIKFPADRPDIALALGQALTAIGSKTALVNSPAPALEALNKDPKPLTSESSSHTEALPTANTAAECQTTSESASAEPDPKQPASLFDTTHGTAEGADEAGAAQQTTQPEAPLADASKLDLNGVAFNAAYCGEAAEPFYATGKMRGQWKKKRGVEQSDYDVWYSSQCLTKEPSGDGLTDDTEALQHAHTVNAASAFGGQPQQVDAPEGPADAGALMVWVSEKQAAGLLTQTDVNEAWGAAGVSSPADLFNDNAATAVAAVYNYLNAKVQ